MLWKRLAALTIALAIGLTMGTLGGCNGETPPADPPPATDPPADDPAPDDDAGADADGDDADY